MEVGVARETMVKSMGGFVEIDGGVLGMWDNGAEIADGVIDGIKVIEVTGVVAAEGANENAHIKIADDEPEGVKVFAMGIDRGCFCRVSRVQWRAETGPLGWGDGSCLGTGVR